MGEYPFFPVFIDLSQKKLIVFGAGRIARRRITTLSQFTPQLTVIAPDCLPEVHDVNNRIHDDCKKRGITVNVSTDRSKSDFYFPGIARKGDIVVGVTASGKDHAGARWVSEKMREMLDHMENV